MPEYDAKKFDPPAPVVLVTLRHPTTGASLSNILLLMDTGADVTILPREAIEQMGIKPVENKAYEVEGFDGKTSLVEVVEVELLFPGKKFKGQFLLMDQPIGIMGRNIMNAVSLILDGPKGFRDEKLA